MHLRYLVPAALIAASTSGYALELGSGDATFNLGVRLQSRFEFWDANDADIHTGTIDDAARSWNFEIRRLRLMMGGKYKDQLGYNMTLRADKIGRESLNDNKEVLVHSAGVNWTIDKGDMKHVIRAEMNDPKLSTADTDSSGKYLMATGRFAPRSSSIPKKSMGIGYDLKASMFDLNIDLKDAQTADAAATSTAGSLFFSARVSTSLSNDMKIAKRSESYLGKPSDGFKHMAGLGVGILTEGNDQENDVTTAVVDYLVHYDALTALLDFSMEMTGADNNDRMIVSLQGGYAIPNNDLVYEPALRFAMIDTDTGADSTDGYEGDGGNDGMYIEAGLNVYFDGHNNKLQATLTSFTPEEGDADAIAFRLQHQLNF